MYLKHVKINNFRGVDCLDFDLKKGVNLLIGDNGVGKTSILEAIAAGLGGMLTDVAGVPVKSIRQDDIRVSVGGRGGASSAIFYYTPVAVSCELDVDGMEFSWTRSRRDESSRVNTLMDHKEICCYMREKTNEPDTILPLLCFESEARVWQMKRGDFGKELKKKLDDRRCGYIGCLDYSMDIKGIQDWCLKMELAAFQQEKKIKEYEVFKDIIASFMQRMSELGTKPKLYYSNRLSDLVYVEEGVERAMSNLSAGYLSLLWMVMNLAYRAALLNPDCEERIRQIPGIVLIDEIDMHLHPKWQWNVITTLENTFPEVQFIIATHSPIVISSCRRQNLILIDGRQEIQYLPSAYAYSMKDVLELRQGSGDQPAEVLELVENFEKAIDREDYEAAERILKQMQQLLGENHSETEKAKEELHMARWIQEN